MGSVAWKHDASLKDLQRSGLPAILAGEVRGRLRGGIALLEEQQTTFARVFARSPWQSCRSSLTETKKLRTGLGAENDVIRE